MPLTELQKSRIAFHLDLVQPNNLLSLDRRVATMILDDSQILALVGETPPPVGNVLTFEGVELCTLSSQLGRVEQAFSNLSPTVIGDSLLVKQAGKVTLRSDELSARQALYETQVQQMCELIGAVDKGSKRVGFNDF